MVDRKMILRRPPPKPPASPAAKPVLKRPVKAANGAATDVPDPFAEDDKPAPSLGGVLAGFAKAREINKINLQNKEARAAKPMVFKVPAGGSANCILLDKEPFKVYLHSWQDNAKRFHEEVCIKTEGFCPVCAKLGQEGTYTLMFTCISLVKFTDREGNKHDFSKMLFPIKPGTAEKFGRLYLKEAKGDVNKGFRGMALKCFRSSSPKAPRTGDDFECAGWFREADMIKKYGADMVTMCDYDKAFQRMTAQELAAKYSVDMSGIPGAEDMGSGDEANWSASGRTPF
jgi:hypothetical protein